MDASMKSSQPEIAVPKKHSMLGIASLLLTLFSCLPVLVVFVFAPAYFTGNPTEITHKLVYWSVGICLVASNPISLILGLIALFQKNTKKLFAILGVTLALFQICLATILIIFILIRSSM
jgi:hypothetical protein